ncbi:MAG: helix-turn-helix transcriptional regulator, partial [Clostridia bacterium]|nr:helix-turn-helix transcriptional regulator [Clostridia bacterium]
ICDRVNLDHLDRICEALECDLTDILVRIPDGSTSEVKSRTRAGTGEKEQDT